MKKRQLLTLITVLLILLTGCSSAERKKNQGKGKEIVMSRTKAKPNWIGTPLSANKDYNGYILAMGVAESVEEYNIQMIRKEALVNAREELSNYIGVDVKGEIVINQEKQQVNKSLNYSKEVRTKQIQTTKNYIENSKPVDNYFEKVNVYQGKNVTATKYRYYVLVAMPKNPLYIPEITKNKYSESNNTLIERKEAPKEVDDYMEEVNRKGFFIGVNGGLSPYVISDFTTDTTGILMEQGNIDTGYELNVEIGREVINTSYYVLGGLYDSEPISMYKLGAGIAKKIFTFKNFDLKTFANGNMIFVSGDVGKLYRDLNIGSKNDVVSIEGIMFGLTPGVKLEMKLTDNFDIYGMAQYDIYADSELYTNVSGAEVSLNNFDPIVDLSGLTLKAGLQFNF